VLIFLGVEGYVCVLMSAPLIAFSLAVGAGLGLLVRWIIRAWRHERIARFLMLAVRVITRKTTIVSRLAPAWYWRPLEKIGVETEHEYLFEEVKRKIEAAK
jgi:hypothetical protein